jgi:hypothetical protein
MAVACNWFNFCVRLHYSFFIFLVVEHTQDKELSKLPNFKIFVSIKVLEFFVKIVVILMEEQSELFFNI